MIERLLAADAALERGDLASAEKLFGSVAEADPRNAIAAVGMGRVAAGRDDADGARTWFQRALEIDPQEAAARRLLTALDRELAASPPVGAVAEAAPEFGAESAARVAPKAAPVASAEAAPSSAAPTSDGAPVAASRRPSLVERIRAWLGLPRTG
jgi:tetratricopeptide (TPR) repeat protein